MVPNGRSGRVFRQIGFDQVNFGILKLGGNIMPFATVPMRSVQGVEEAK